MRRFFGYLVLAGSYVAFSYLVLPPRAQADIISIVWNSKSLHAVDPNDVLSQIEQNLKAVEARVAARKNDALMTRLDDIRQRQKMAVADLDMINSLVGPLDVDMKSLQKRIDQVQKKTESSKLLTQVDGLGDSLASLKMNVDRLASIRSRADELSRSLGAVEATVSYLNDRDAGALAVLSGVKDKIARVQTLIQNIEKGDNPPSTQSDRRKTFAQQVQEADTAYVELKRKLNSLEVAVEQLNGVRSAFGTNRPAIAQSP